MDNYVEGLDSFGKEVPSFNLKGEPRINTICGGAATIAIFALTLIYASIKMIELVGRRNPTINDSKIDNEFPASETVNLNDINWRMAFSVENFGTRDAIFDPRYVKWIVRFLEKRGENFTERRLSTHKCTAEDFEMFHEVSLKDSAEFKTIVESENRGLMCLDKWEDDFFIGGEYSSSLYSSLDLIMAPCNYIHHEISDWGDTVAPECIPDQQQQLEYMGPLDVVIYMNSERFEQNNYDEESIVKEAVILHKQVD